MSSDEIRSRIEEKRDCIRIKATRKVSSIGRIRKTCGPRRFIGVKSLGKVPKKKKLVQNSVPRH